ncbi:MAG TPA: bacillithiol system redox-active protein YtxJ [Planctomycetota bacterium]|nr:bacillithiol system redox-active protein YtxJ [Planctomycetota bacterium]
MINLKSVSELEQTLREKKRPVVLFKHSTQCPISAAADEEFRTFVDSHPDAAVFAHLDLLAHRDVSKAIAEKLGVTHESPQAIVIKGGKVSGVLNHHEITGEAIDSMLRDSSSPS